jgi:hypothetical protein
MFLENPKNEFKNKKKRGNSAVFRLVTGYGWIFVFLFLGCDHKKNGCPQNLKIYLYNL